MKKSILFCAAVMMAASINATEKTIDIDLAKYTLAGYQAEKATPTLNAAGDELTVAYDLGGWEGAGVEFALDNLDVTNIGFEYIGGAEATKWTSFQVYLTDANGVRFISAAADLAISSWVSEWTAKKYMPADELWGDAANPHTPQAPYTAIGFLANPSEATASTFGIRNVKVYVNDTETALQTPAVSGGVTKTVESGQVYILRDGLRYNTLGAVVE